MSVHRTGVEIVQALGQSEDFLNFEESLSRVAPVDRPVLIIGERGTGKELAAQRLHYLSKRWEEPFIALNCAALAPSLIESELFGHEVGAFTGATMRRKGRFESADGGTLFLDELARIPIEVQEKILRVVEYGSFERVGGTAAIQADVRIVGATNADLPALAAQGLFMRDLLDRLSFEVLHVPPLRERHGDIPLLAEHFAQRMAVELGRKEAPEFSEDVMKQLEAHPWRGNIRELKNVIERAVYQTDGNRIDTVVFNPFDVPYEHHLETPASSVAPVTSSTTPLPEHLNFTEAVEAFEIKLLSTTLQRARFNQRITAQKLGLSYNQFRGLFRKYRHVLDQQ
ncbi:MAG TPA: phage shock protein operon transcriptional activator [Candidatus Hydrogenedentes bacterium]|nr:phage shock protein operon transcriptional activator [Candidatus Hydrogenedentota bacterium]